jgi:hypothetical protein
MRFRDDILRGIRMAAILFALGMLGIAAYRMLRIEPAQQTNAAAPKAAPAPVKPAPKAAPEKRTSAPHTVIPPPPPSRSGASATKAAPPAAREDAPDRTADRQP